MHMQSAKWTEANWMLANGETYKHDCVALAAVAHKAHTNAFPLDLPTLRERTCAKI